MMYWLHELTTDKAPDLPAVIDHDGRRYSYGDLEAMVQAMAVELARFGLRPGDRLIAVAENSATYLVAILAASRLQAWITPANARQSPDEIDAMLAHSGARAVVFTPEASPDARAHAARMEAREVGCLACGKILLAGPFDTAPEPVEDDPTQRVAALMYTTGTTSAPKGVMLTHANLMWNARSSAGWREMKPEEVVLAVLPGTHIFCFASGMLAALHAGACIRFIPRFSPQAVLDAFAEGDAIMPAVPQMYQSIAHHLESRGEKPYAPGLRYISSGGAPLDPDFKARIELLFGLPLNNGYGLTETSPGVAGTRNARPRSDTAVGEILPDVECLIDNPDQGGVGELLIRGPNVMKGYYRDPEATARAIRADGFFRSGDLARIGADGALHLMGRLKELIIRSGFNVFPPEVEAMLTRHPDILQAAVVGRQVKGNEEVLAFVLTQGNITEAGVKDYLHAHLAGYKVPSHVFIVDEFPRAATGKILKHKLTHVFAPLIALRDARKEREG
jgi:acyl-CoA synthetase (AMP-forming)/AMP-acid ligase II